MKVYEGLPNGYSTSTIIKKASFDVAIECINAASKCKPFSNNEFPKTKQNKTMASYNYPIIVYIKPTYSIGSPTQIS